MDQSGISTVITKAKAYLAPRHINHDQQSESTSGTAGHDGRVFGKAKMQLAQPYINKEQQSESAAGRHSRVDQNNGLSTAISRTKAQRAQQAMTFSKPTTQLEQPYINKQRAASESISGRHSRVDQSGTSTAISKAKAYLAPRYINHDQQSKGTSGTAGHDV